MQGTAPGGSGAARPPQFEEPSGASGSSPSRALVSARELELVREGYRAFERGDLDWLMTHFDAAILVEDRFESPDSATFHGHAGFLRYLEGWLSAWEQFRMEPVEFIPVRDQVLVLVRQFGRGKGSQVEIEEEVAHLWTVREEKAIGYRVYTHQSDALAAVGIER
jgi:ketosteroid isomerase-like protein